MKKKIGVLTATRAEFGLLKPLILNLMKEEMFDVKVLVTGAHLSADFGYTYNEIEEAGIPIEVKIECVCGSSTPLDINCNMAMALNGFAQYFHNNKLDLLIVLGDRYETLAVCIAAMNESIPIAHIHGGETTEGAIDEAIRHSITKMSQLHFTSTEMYRRRVIQLGEQPDRVFNVGALAVENILNTKFIDKEILGKELGIDLSKKYGVVTYHPVTLEKNSGVEQVDELLSALNYFSEMSFIITKSNADAGGNIINNKLDEYGKKHDNVVVVTSLGVARYLSAVKESSVVIGNSSSGIIEAPCLQVPTVNIGDRQKGRYMMESIICCVPKKKEIAESIKKAMSEEFNNLIRNMDNPLGNGTTSDKIINVLKNTFVMEKSINPQKKFYELR